MKFRVFSNSSINQNLNGGQKQEIIEYGRLLLHNNVMYLLTKKYGIFSKKILTNYDCNAILCLWLAYANQRKGYTYELNKGY